MHQAELQSRPQPHVPGQLVGSFFYGEPSLKGSRRWDGSLSVLLPKKLALQQNCIGFGCYLVLMQQLRFFPLKQTRADKDLLPSRPPYFGPKFGCLVLLSLGLRCLEWDTSIEGFFDQVINSTDFFVGRLQG